MTTSSPSSPNGRTIALVTGANKGLGREIARQLAARGLTVLATARDAQRGEHAALQLSAHGDVRFVELDVTDQASIDAAAAGIGQEFGRLDVLVNNAGVAANEPAPSDITADAVRDVFTTNVFGTVAVTSTMLPLLRRSPAGRIVNLSSTQGSLTLAADPESPYGGGPNTLAYNASKTAVNAITLAYANDLRDTPIKVNAASPGYVKTDLNDNRGTVSVDQGATVPVLLATLDQDGPTGTFVMDNGSSHGEPAPW